VAEEPLVQAEARQAPEARREGAGDVERDAELLVLLLADPAGAVIMIGLRYLCTAVRGTRRYAAPGASILTVRASPGKVPGTRAPPPRPLPKVA
jgi:hypothetical protein